MDQKPIVPKAGRKFLNFVPQVTPGGARQLLGFYAEPGRPYPNGIYRLQWDDDGHFHDEYTAFAGMAACQNCQAIVHSERSGATVQLNFELYQAGYEPINEVVENTLSASYALAYQNRLTHLRAMLKSPAPRGQPTPGLDYFRFKRGGVVVLDAAWLPNTPTLRKGRGLSAGFPASVGQQWPPSHFGSCAAGNIAFPPFGGRGS